MAKMPLLVIQQIIEAIKSSRFLSGEPVYMQLMFAFPQFLDSDSLRVCTRKISLKMFKST